MKVSARNTFPGTIAKVTIGAVNAEVLLTTTGGIRLSPASPTEALKLWR
jgi:molybdopterin-binding protein